MNCSVCGGPLLFDRVVFRCECGAYVHSYCVDKHIVSSHRPALEEGYADLNGDFRLKYPPTQEAAPTLAAMSSISSEAAFKPADEDGETGEDLLSEEGMESAESFVPDVEEEDDQPDDD